MGLRDRSVSRLWTLVASTGATVLLIGGVEVGLRLGGATFDASPLVLVGAGTEEAWARRREGLFRHHPELFWELRPGSVDAHSGDVSNAHTFRGPALEEGGDDSGLRIALLGDSCTYGVSLDYAQSYGSRLADFLTTSNPHLRVEVINAGVPGYTLHQGAIALRSKVLPLHPDVAIFYFGHWNDGKYAIGASDGERARANRSGRLENALGRLAVFRMLRSWIRGSGGAPAERLKERDVRAPYVEAWLAGAPLDGYRVSPDEFEELLHGALERCATEGIEAIVVMPELNVAGLAAQGEAFQLRRGELLAAYRERIERVARARGVLTVDMRALFEGRDPVDLFLPDSIHPSANGYVVLARGLFDAIEAQGWVPALEPGSAPSQGKSLVCDRLDVPAGGQVRLELEAGVERGGQDFVLVPSLCAASMSATQRFPLALDALAQTAFLAGELPAQLGLRGTLDHEGRATTEVRVPPSVKGPAWLGFCFATDAGAGPMSVESVVNSWASNDVWVRIVASE